MWRRLLLALAAAGGLSATLAVALPLGALAGLQHGRWSLKEIGTASAPRLVCAPDPAELIQLNHPGDVCTRYTIDDTPNRVTIQYNCQKRGYGRTTITVENAGLMRLDTQGIDSAGQPFDTSYEGRFVGSCGPAPRR
ncbi:MAG: hypothetical protein V4459_11700 [Pseudomonadota bacterium]